MNERHVSGELPAFALEALDASDRLRVAAHLANCAACGEELAAFDQTASVLVTGRFIEAPRTVWAAIESDVGTPRGPVRFLGHWRWLVATAAAVAIVGLLAWNLALQFGDGGEDGVAALAARKDGSVIPLAGTMAAGRLSGRLYVSDDGLQGGLAVSGLDGLAAGVEYEIWFIRADQTRAEGGSFRPDPRGQALVKVVIPGPLDGFVGVGISPRGAPGANADVLAGPIYER